MPLNFAAMSTLRDLFGTLERCKNTKMKITDRFKMCQHAPDFNIFLKDLHVHSALFKFACALNFVQIRQFACRTCERPFLANDVFSNPSYLPILFLWAMFSMFKKSLRVPIYQKKSSPLLSKTQTTSRHLVPNRAAAWTSEAQRLCTRQQAKAA